LSYRRQKGEGWDATLEQGWEHMARKKAGQDQISEKLHEAIDGLRKDVTRVEIWATALSTFAKPVPDYKPNPKYQLGQPVETRDPAENDTRGPAKDATAKVSE
jgi:hypothetical protein